MDNTLSNLTYREIIAKASPKIKSILVDVLQFPATSNGMQAICKAVIVTKAGKTFSDIGDACPASVGEAKFANHLVTIATTRAKMRCLRDMLGTKDVVSYSDDPATLPQIHAITKLYKQLGKYADGNEFGKLNKISASKLITSLNSDLHSLG